MSWVTLPLATMSWGNLIECIRDLWEIMSKSRIFLGSFGCLALCCALGGAVSRPALAEAKPEATAKYALTIKHAGTGTGTVTSSPTGISCGGTCAASYTKGTSVKLTASPKSGSKFAYWSGSCSGTATSCSVSVSAAKTVTATFSAVYALTIKDAGTGAGTVTSSPSGISCGGTCSASYTKGTSIKLTEAPKSGSKFAGWSGSCSGTATSCTVSISAAKSVTATFTSTAASTYALTITDAGTGAGTVTSGPTGISCGSMCSASFSKGASVKLTAAPASGSKFASWSGACSGTATTCTVALSAAKAVTATFTVIPTTTAAITVVSVGTGTGTVTSSPAGINCPGICSASFSKGAQVVLTAAADSGDTFEGWAGQCTGKGTCSLTPQSNATLSPTFESGTADIKVINHIVFFAQENRSLDNWLGALRQYWAANGIPDQSFDGLPQFNPKTGEAPLYAAPPTNPGCNPNDPMPDDCVLDTAVSVASFHMKTVCDENTSPSWNEAHVDWNYGDQVGKYAAKNNGFVHTAAGDARKNPGTPFHDVNGLRAMGYWDGDDLNYDYFMATSFATSDRFFQPAMSRTNINREYLHAATSGGYAYPNGTVPADTPQLKSETIFQKLSAAGITWKVYVNPEGTGCTTPYKASCLIQSAYLENFGWASTILKSYPNNIAPISEYYSDLTNGTLPQVAEIMPPSDAGLDDHGSDSDAAPENVQEGERYVSTIINAFMDSSAWQDSAFFFTFDESGGLYDHVSPQPMPSPDGIKPLDLGTSGSVCSTGTTQGPTCDFTWTGYRIPLTVISPYAKKNYVSHTVADSTAILKFIETRFGLTPLNKRDAAQIDMTEFFDFNNPAWVAPPSPPTQNTSNPCYLNTVP
jgi:phospholipase C